MRIFFDTLHLYYLTQYLPVFRELQRRGVDARFVIYDDPGMEQAIRRVIEKESLPVVRAASLKHALSHYQKERPAWVVFGNGFPMLAELPEGTRSAQLYHGIGVKSDAYRPELMEMDIRFLEGPHYTEAITRMFPGRPVLEVGYAKLDPLFGPAACRPTVALDEVGLCSSRKTILYAPTFYPSSIELMPDDWPRQFPEYNIIVKPHYFSWSKRRYRSQRRKLMLWGEYPNVYLPPADEFNLLPYMGSADLMISDASSALFEFAALDKPVVWCDFLKLRWSYRGPLRFRLKKRLDSSIRQYHDIAVHARRYEELGTLIGEQLENPSSNSRIRLAHAHLLVGKTDGRVAERIVDYLLGDSF